MKVIIPIRLNFILCLIIISVGASGQNDTTIYYSRTLKVVDSKSNAYYYSKFMKLYAGTFALLEYSLKDKQWTEQRNTIIKQETDSSFKLTVNSNSQKGNKDLISRRFFNKTDKGFNIRDYNDTNLLQEGESKLLFPLIKFGNWKVFDPSTGLIIFEQKYIDNNCIVSTYWVNEKESIPNVFTRTDKMPEYEDGDSVLLNFIAAHTNYPEKAVKRNISGRVIVKFIVMFDGSIRDVSVLKSVDPLLDNEAIRVANSIPKDKWKPGELEGEKVNVLYMVPINFTLK